MSQILIGKEFPQQVIPLIDLAKKSIEIIVFDWRWYPQDPGSSCQLFNQALVRAARRGVAVRAISNNNEINKTLNGLGCRAKKIVSQRLVHCKIIIVDNEILITGSHNFTQSAFNLNYEMSVILHDPEAALTAQNFFNNLFNL
jgi:phosphatidylserine/phosphatidylglycerophosphate/cardiolipin synthase-like enzyme